MRAAAARPRRRSFATLLMRAEPATQTGVMEFWNNGMMGLRPRGFVFFQYSTIPPFLNNSFFIAVVGL
jgi:hypothetical protein